jgi:hypothetical protein
LKEPFGKDIRAKADDISIAAISVLRASGETKQNLFPGS